MRSRWIETTKKVLSLLPKRILLWEKGYDCTGNSAPDHLIGVYLAMDYEDACQQELKKRKLNPYGYGTAEVQHRVESGIHYWWGCAWYEKK